MLVGTGVSATVRPYEVPIWHMKTWLWGAADKRFWIELHKLIGKKEVGKVSPTTLRARRFCPLLLCN